MRRRRSSAGERRLDPPGETAARLPWRGFRRACRSRRLRRSSLRVAVGIRLPSVAWAQPRWSCSATRAGGLRATPRCPRRPQRAPCATERGRPAQVGRRAQRGSPGRVARRSTPCR
eukprot:15034980-Alexandrium_andersonii.AAC.1